MLCSMSCLSPGSAGVVHNINVAGAMGRRLVDIGLVEGAPVECVQKSPLGDPAAYLIRGAIIALRCEVTNEVTLRTA